MVKMLLLFLFMTSAFANPNPIFSIGKSLVIFERIDGLFVNKSCGRSCLAFTQGKNLKLQKMKAADLTGGKNPGSVRCSKLLKGKVVIGRNGNGDQQSFCHFPDDSYLMN